MIVKSGYHRILLEVKQNYKMQSKEFFLKFYTDWEQNWNKNKLSTLARERDSFKFASFLVSTWKNLSFLYRYFWFCVVLVQPFEEAKPCSLCQQEKSSKLICLSKNWKYDEQKQKIILDEEMPNILKFA